MKRVLIESILHLAVFMEIADEDTLDNDTAVKLMENLATDLKEMTVDEQQDFLLCLEEIADTWEQQGVNKTETTWVRTFGEAYGLVDGLDNGLDNGPRPEQASFL